MQAHEIMTRDVVTVDRTATVEEIAAILLKRRISAVPVVTEDDRVIGIVSESDLCHRAETSTERKRKWWLEAFTDKDTLASEYIKSHGRKADNVMSRVVVSVSDDAVLSDIADILDAHRIRRVPVTREGRLVGLISRSDLVRALTQVKLDTPGERKDHGAVQKLILDKIRAQPWMKGMSVSLTVNEDEIEVWAVVDTKEQQRALVVLVDEFAGGRKIVDNVHLYPPMVAA